MQPRGRCGDLYEAAEDDIAAGLRVLGVAVELS
jgi:hypothetical protein